MVIIKNYKVKKLFNKFPEISGKIRMNFRKFSEGNFRTHNPTSISLTITT